MNKELFLESINRNMKYDEEIIKKVYGFELSFPGFAEVALGKLEAVGFANARADYLELKNKYEKQESKRNDGFVLNNNKIKDNICILDDGIRVLKDMQEKEMDWLISDMIPRGQITILVGDGGCGKTSIWCALAAAISSGQQPFVLDGVMHKGCEGVEPEKVLFFSAEDSIEHVLIKRLKCNGANLENIISMDIANPQFSKVKFGSPYLGKLIEKYRPSLCIFDPIQAFLQPNIRMAERNAMRESLKVLLKYGEKYGTTFIIVVHSNKQSGVSGRKRMADSADIWDISRSVFMVGKTAEDGINYISHEKSNYGKLAKTVLFKILDGKVVFEGYSLKKDCDFVVEANAIIRQSPQRKKAKEFILTFLQDGTKESSELENRAKEEGISANSLRFAKSDLKKEGMINISAVGFREKKYYLTLTEKAKSNNHDK
ncbi:AAA family ATPase [Sporofaciens sp. SGI.106]|uniref:AAA family ATPase n=1 Tax=Sporofaciens sp. SGI.106 TaxID=3420568 RepID=UPI003D031F74